MIMEDYLERKEQENEFEKISVEVCQKVQKDKTAAEIMRNMAMQRLSESKRSNEDRPKKKGSHAMKQCIILKLKQTLEVKQKTQEAMTKQSELLMQQQQDMMQNFQQLASQQQQSEQMMQMTMMIMQQQQHQMQQQMQQTEALLNIIAKRRNRHKQ